MSRRGTAAGIALSAVILAVATREGSTVISASEPVGSAAQPVAEVAASTPTTTPGEMPTASAPQNNVQPQSQPSAPAAAPNPSPATTGLKDGTYTGTAESTRYGTEQVKVVVSGGKITDVIALQSTDREGRSVQISSYATPILRQEVIQAQSTNVDMVSGATYTSTGYLASVQSALDQAR